jgi:hypothetical protein
VSLDADFQTWLQTVGDVRETDCIQAVTRGEESISFSYLLEAAYPNPFNYSTTISYALAGPSEIRLEIFDVLGKRVRVVDHGHKSMGEYEIQFDATGLAPGTYFYSLSAGNFRQTKKMVLLR